MPLFVEELTRTVLEAGLLEDAGDRYVLDEPLPSVAIPMTLQDSLMARLDRLGPAKEVAQLAACLGREFTHGMLAAVAAQNEEQLRIALDRLAGSGLVVCDGEPPAATYSFRHALVQEAAYGSLLKSRRRELHARIASTVERRFPDVVGAPARVAGPPSHGGGPSQARGRALAEGGAARQGRLREQGGAIPSAPVPDGGREARRASGGAAPDLDGHELEALVLLGDLASLAGDLGEANRWYEQALAIASDPQTRSGIERKRHRPRTAFRDGARIAFYEHGSGPETLLFVAPLAYGLATFQPIVERLCQEFRVVTIDSRGTGASDPLVRPVPAQRARQGRAYRDRDLGWRAGNRRRALARRQSPAQARPRRAAPLRASWSRSAARRDRPAVTVLLRGVPAGAPTSWSSKGDLEGIVRFHTSLVFSEPATRELQELFVRTRLELPSETMLSFFDPDPTVEVTPILGEIAVPVLVTHGSVDRLILLEAAEFIRARLPDARLYVFEGKGHLPLFTATDEFCEVLRGFAQTGTFAPSEAEIEARR